MPRPRALRSVGRARRVVATTERARIFVFDGGDIPDFTPLAGWVLTGFAILVTLGIAIALAADWEQVLLWQHRVPFSPTASVTDPVFGRDISFFLFELPFWRTLQTIANGLLFTALVLAGGRYAVAASRGGGVFTVPVRLHLGVLAALFIATIAVGFQLDKLELAHGSNGTVAGVSYTDAHARFFANDLLTIISAILAVAILVLALSRRGWRAFGIRRGRVGRRARPGRRAAARDRPAIRGRAQRARPGAPRTSPTT